MNIFRKFTAGATLVAGLAILPTAQAQLLSPGMSNTTIATGLVTPRTYVVFSNQVLGASGALMLGTNTNSANITNWNSQLGLTNGWLTNQNVYIQAPTLMGAASVQEIGLTAVIGNSNKFAQASNIVINIYPAYDTSGGSTAVIAPRYGTLFSANPILTWTVSTLSNTIVGTNLLKTSWAPATALGYTVSNTTLSNISLSLFQTDVP